MNDPPRRGFKIKKGGNIMDKFKKITTPEQANELAAEFSKQMLRCLGVEKLREAVRRNDKERDKRICHTHDFCDANEVMIDAMDELGYELDDGEDDGEDNCDGINMAWGIASANKFNIEL
jgi:hypothetical protein